MNIFINYLSGWYRQCDIIPYTTDFDTAAWASEVDDLNDLMRLLHNRRYVTLKHKMGLVRVMSCNVLMSNSLYNYANPKGKCVYSFHY